MVILVKYCYSEVTSDRLNLVTCKYCDRTFFPKSLDKHVISCEREWMRVNCRNDKNPSKCSGPYIKEHIAGYKVQIKTFSDMLALGAERRKRWRMRHEEFIRTVNLAKANILKDTSKKIDFIDRLDPELAQTGLTQCEYCKRRFNDAAYYKHKDQCKAKKTDIQPEQTEEQKEAKERFLKRMKYSMKLASKLSSESQSNERMNMCESQNAGTEDTVRFGTDEPPLTQQQSKLISKLADELCADLNISKTPFFEMLQANAFGKLIKSNLTSLLVNTPLQMSNCNHLNTTDSSTSLPFFSASSMESTSAAPSAVVLSDASAPIKTENSKMKSDKQSESRFVGTNGFQNKSSAANSSSHHSHRSLKPPPTVVDNFMLDFNRENSPKADQNINEQIGRNGKLNSESKSSQRDSGIKHKESCEIPDKNKDAKVVFYKFNKSAGEFSEEHRIFRKQKHPLQLKLPRNQHLTDGEASISATTSTINMAQDNCLSSSSLSLRTPGVQESDVSFSSVRYTEGAHISGNRDTPRESQSCNLRNLNKTETHHSNHRHCNCHRRHHHKHSDAPGTQCVMPSTSQDSSLFKGSTIVSPEGGLKKTTFRYCQHCGKKFLYNARFCSFCGSIRKSKVSSGSDSMATSVSQLTSKT